MAEKGLIVISHGHFAVEALNSAEMIIGKQEFVEAVSLMPGEALEGLKKKIEESIKNLKECSQIFILFDIYGGTPSNASMNFAVRRDDIKVISGLNIPMLIEFFTHRELPAGELARRIIDLGRESIMDLEPIISKAK